MKQSLFTAISLILLVSIFTITGCKQTEKEIVPSGEYMTYINAYTGGVISQNGSIKIELTKEQEVVDLNNEIKGKPISFSPAMKGKAYWRDNKTIEFQPEEGQLKSGQIYIASFNLKQFADVPKELEKFKFSFRVIEKNFTFHLNEIDIPEHNSKVVNISGEIQFSDIETRSNVEKMLSVERDGKVQNLTINLNGDTDSDRYGFVIQSVQREDEDIELVVKADGNVVGISQKTEARVTVPTKNSFIVLSAKKISEPENGLQIIFSEPIASSQNLKGLIEIPELKSFVSQIVDNKINIFFDSGNLSNITLNIHAGIKSANDMVLKKTSVYSFSIEIPSPEIKLLSTGTILPDSKKLFIPFQAVSLYAVDVNIIRIYESNILSFLQNNTLNSSNELRRSGRLVYKKMFRLDNNPSLNLNEWNTHSIDLSELIEQEPGAIYRVEFSFKEEYSAYPCGGEEIKQFALTDEMTGFSSGKISDADEAVWDVPNGYYYGRYNIDWDVYEWSERNNPCHPTYYMESRTETCNVLASNIGIIAKQNAANKLWVTVTDILTTQPLSQADVTVYNFQLQVIGNAKTDNNGFVEIAPKGKPFIVMASSGKQKTYLKVNEGEENSTSRFDVGGKETKKGLKGYIYGERGVWRPGDTLHISFILKDHEKRIPDTHPVSFELYNPRGQFYSKQISTEGINGFYTFHVPTTDSDPTGLWNAYIKVGGAAFHKSLRIETVKPNRLKINLKLPKDYIDASKKTVPAKLSASWLTGATASNLEAKIEMSLSRINTQFDKYKQYIFNDPASSFTSSKTDILEKVLDGSGNLSFDLEIPYSKNAPGMLQANIITRVFEPGGDASINTLSIPLSPFSSYVGINLNEPKDKYIETDTDHVFEIVTLTPEGKPINRSNLEYKVYRIDWSWWWENRNNSFDSYINNSSITPEASGTISTINGKAKFNFRVDYPQWGRYLVYVKDVDSGHATGGTVFIDWPDWRGRSGKEDPSGITMLSFSVDKESYSPGETVNVIIPASATGRALVALENGSTVLKREWVEVSDKGDTKYQFTVTPEMAPNIYVHISLLQAHAQTINDLPIRMYGVLPVFVDNKESKLEPVIKMPDVLRPEKEFSVSVSEKQGKAMTYTLAIVDDGLLDLTNFKTPNPWSEFYAREALGIRTWDMFDQVIGAFSGSYSSLFSVGGDEMLKAQDSKANRFRPVVKFLGPFTIEKGKTKTHKIMMPSYVGSVRTMLVAGYGEAYGSAEKTSPVRSPLMVLSTLPRVISIGEEILVPVNVFAMEESVKDVSVSIETSDKVQLVEGKKKSVSFDTPGDKLLYFKIKVGMNTGKETIHITASGNGHTAKEKIEIDVRNPNPAITLFENKVLNKGESLSLPYQVSGNQDGSWINLEVSRIPPVDISRRFDFLYNYQHYCSEQLVSRALPLLFISNFKTVDTKEMESIKKNVQQAIKNLYGRQLSNGGFAYWPGNTYADEWVSSYAGNFLVLAQEKGYDVNTNVITKWKTYQRKIAQNWKQEESNSSYYWQSDLQQAYRLYTLALAGAPETGVMNRLKEAKELSVQAKWRLAAAYAISGKQSAANELVFNAKTTIEEYSSNNSIYGSSDRDEAMILETLVLLDKKTEIYEQAKKVSKNLSNETYFSTQSTAFSLMAMGRVAEKLSGNIDMTWSLNNKKQDDIKTAKPIYQASIPTSPSKGSIALTNKADGDLYVNLITYSQLVNDTLPEISNNLKINVSYLDAAGKSIDVTNLKQGTDITARVTISNISGTSDYTNLALTHIVPSGWEIYNERLFDQQESESDNHISYQDIRDDRVLTYFDLRRNREISIDIRLQAAYAGTFILPAIQCEAMYDTKVHARTKAGQVTVEP